MCREEQTGRTSSIGIECKKYIAYGRSDSYMFTNEHCYLKINNERE